MLGIPDEDKRKSLKRKKKGVTFNEEEEIINPEDIDPTVGRFRNLVQTTVIPTSKVSLLVSTLKSICSILPGTNNNKILNMCSVQRWILDWCRHTQQLNTLFLERQLVCMMTCHPIPSALFQRPFLPRSHRSSIFHCLTRLQILSLQMSHINHRKLSLLLMHPHYLLQIFRMNRKRKNMRKKPGRERNKGIQTFCYSLFIRLILFLNNCPLFFKLLVLYDYLTQLCNVTCILILDYRIKLK